MSDEQRKDEEEVEGHLRKFPASDEATDETKDEDEGEVEAHAHKLDAHKLD
jgi:hypothetical protein